MPKDGLPISEWTNENVAFLDVVAALRRVIEGKTQETAAAATSTGPSAGGIARRLRVKRDFDSIERSDFRDAAFETIRSYFDSSVSEIDQIDDLIRARYQAMSPTAFTCTIVNRGKHNGESHITVHNHKAQGGLGDITYTYDSYSTANHANGSVMVQADEYQLYLTTERFIYGGRDQKLTAEQVAEQLWTDFVSRAGIDYA